MSKDKFYAMCQSLHNKGYLTLTKPSEHEQPDVGVQEQNCTHAVVENQILNCF